MDGRYSPYVTDRVTNLPSHNQVQEELTFEIALDLLEKRAAKESHQPVSAAYKRPRRKNGRQKPVVAKKSHDEENCRKEDRSEKRRKRAKPLNL